MRILIGTKGRCHVPYTPVSPERRKKKEVFISPHRCEEQAHLDPIHIPSIEHILRKRVLNDQTFSSCNQNLVHMFSDILCSIPFVLNDMFNTPLDLLQTMLKVTFTKGKWLVNQRLAIEIEQIENLD